MRDAETEAVVAVIIGMLRKIIYEPGTAITAQTMVVELGLDSLDLMEVGLELEAVMGRELPDGVLFTLRTIGDLADCFAARSPAARLSLAA